jgi:hypothetical protein
MTDIMKKISFVLLAGLLSACSAHSSVGETDTEEEEVVDTDINDEERNFNSPDLTLNALHSKVDCAVTLTYAASMKNGELNKGKLVQVDSLYFDEAGRMIRKVVNISEAWTSSSVETFEYDTDGKLKSGKAVQKYGNESYKYKVKMNRNQDDYIVGIKYISDIKDVTMDSTDEYVWDNGLLTSFTNTGYEWTTTSEYKYDDDGLLHQERVESGEEGMVSITTIKYDYKDFDEFNNWTNCSVKEVTDSYEDYEVLTKVGESEVAYKIKERQIIYRK